jgi:hypothetical protein
MNTAGPAPITAGSHVFVTDMFPYQLFQDIVKMHSVIQINDFNHFMIYVNIKRRQQFF